MKSTETYLAEIKEVRRMMEQSSRFLSLSGLSGVLAGIYALAGAYIAWRVIYFRQESEPEQVMTLFLLGSVVLILVFLTGSWLTLRKTRKLGNKIWTPGSRQLCLNLAVPLVSGGILILIFIIRGLYSMVAPFCLVFYGLALVNAAKFTRQEIFYMGLLQTLLGILAALLPEWGLLFWAIGFGLVHIIYGSAMYFKYEHKQA